LRTISAALKMITDIERIGDQAADICRILLERKRAAFALPDVPPDVSPGVLLSGSLSRVEHLVALGEAATAQVSAAIDAFVTRNLARAQAVIADDDQIDLLFGTVKDEIFAWMKDSYEVQDVTIDLLLIAKYFERVGDHAQNIAEWVEYSITGMHKGALIA
jgi:phosphate transport system protein